MVAPAIQTLEMGDKASKMTTEYNISSGKGSFYIYKYYDRFPWFKQSINIVNAHNFSHTTMLNSTKCEFRYIDKNFNTLEAIGPINFSKIEPLNRQSPLPEYNTTHYFLHHESKEILWIANTVSNKTIINESCSNLDLAECNRRSCNNCKEWPSPRRRVHRLNRAWEMLRLLSEFRNAAKYLLNARHRLVFIDSEDQLETTIRRFCSNFASESKTILLIGHGDSSGCTGKYLINNEDSIDNRKLLEMIEMCVGCHPKCYTFFIPCYCGVALGIQHHTSKKLNLKLYPLYSVRPNGQADFQTHSRIHLVPSDNDDILYVDSCIEELQMLLEPTKT